MPMIAGTMCGKTRLRLAKASMGSDAVSDASDFRRAWRLRWWGCLSDFADIDLQRRRWLDPENTNPHWSYVEFMCSYFNDLLCDQGYDWASNEGLVTKEEVQAVAALHGLLDRHAAPQGDDYDNEKVLNDPAGTRS